MKTPDPKTQQSSESDGQALLEIKLPCRGRPPRIVVVDDERVLVEILGDLIRIWIKEATLLLFNDSTKAWEELSRQDPDLLITDDLMPCLCGQEICERLLERRATYPIIVRSTLTDSESWVRQLARGGLNVSFLWPLPCDNAALLRFRSLVEAALLTGETVGAD
jgi:CheY-like chemotaxis protein